MSGPHDTQPSLAAPVARRVLGRCLMLQASWNDQRMQNLGLLAALAPWLRQQNLDRERLRRICRRYYGYFNTNPYLAGFVVGGLLRLERDRLAGQEVPDRLVSGFRDTLARACGSLGDQLFWLGLRPALTLLACLFAALGQWWVVLVLVAAMTAVQLQLRRWSLQQGFERGCDVVDVLADPRWHRLIAWTARAALVLTGLMAGCYFAGVLTPNGGVAPLRLAGIVVVGLALPVLVRQKVAGEIQLLLALAGVVLLAMFT
jgi:mannose/fructose/N-acetylgalactosamine-specific phosphotransferase system component IID